MSYIRKTLFYYIGSWYHFRWKFQFNLAFGCVKHNIKTVKLHWGVTKLESTQLNWKKESLST
jgi:hypothetical protein